MPTVVGVAFRPVTKVYYFDPLGLVDLAADEYVIVETSRGRTMGQVVFSPREVDESEVAGALKPVVRRATAWDMVQADQMTHREPEALQIAVARAQSLGMNIKISKVEFSFDGSSAVVYFTSEQRVDFRNLVHDLSQQLRTRVEMRQVGVRDEAKFIGGFGKCGRELCCATWLREFTPVSIKMAKTQDLPLNAPEVSGVCGRLLCCLAYENDFYTEARKQMPRVNSLVETPEGVGKVRQVHVLANTITVLVEGPNETRSWVQMPVPEPQFAVSARLAVGQADAGDAMDAAIEAADELDAQDGMDAPGEDVIPGRERGQQRMPDEASSTGPRSGLRKRRKR
jgi:cell fate regulator YaaT (PSP1 superfamily)